MDFDLEDLGGGGRNAVVGVAAVLAHVLPANPGYVESGALCIRSYMKYFTVKMRMTDM